VIPHSPALDGVRGIAILLVLAHHLTVVRPATPFDEVTLAVLHKGWAGVDVFLVLSGFLITGILIDSRDSPRYFKSFYVRRTLRIFPLFYLVIFLSYYVLPLFPTWYQRLVGAGGAPPQWQYWLFVSNFAIAERNQFQHGILDISWSLAIEEQFYLVWPVVVWLCPPAWLGTLCGVIITSVPLLRAFAIASGAPELEVYVSTPYRADALAAGGGLAWVSRRPLGASIRPLGPWAFWAGVGGVGGLVWWDGHTSWDGGLKQFVGYSFLALAASGLVLCAMREPGRSRWPRALAAGWLRTFGRYSYCLYLIHLPVMWIMRYAVFDPSRGPLVVGSALPAQVGFWALTVPVALGLAWLSWRCFEQPVLRLKRFFPY
jgi:peptidoglycan/LPS O-acetylase OafA/YrhL